MRKKRITVVMTLCIIVSLLSGCTTKESEGIILEDDTEVTEEVVEEETDDYMSVTEEEFSETEKSENDIEVTTEINVYEILESINDYPLYFLVDTLSDGQENEMGTTYDVQDNGDGYTVTGTIKALDVIMKDTGIEGMEEGDEVTSALGIKYIVTYNDHASSGNSIKIEMNDMEGNIYYILSSLSGTGLTSSFVNVLEIDSGLAVVKTYEHVSFEVPIGSALIYPSGLLLDIGGEEVTDYQGIWMPDGVIHSNNLPEDIDDAVYDENGNVS